MAFWCRTNQSKLKHITHQFRRYYIQVPSLNHSASLTEVFETKKQPFWENTFKKPTEFCINVRFFAAPVQALQRKDEKEITGPRLNDKITAQFVRLVTDEGHKVVSRHEALSLAMKLQQDLVEVDRNANPPVCKIMDFHKEMYQKELKEKAKAKSDTTLKKGNCKEVRFSGKIEQKDLQMKADTVKRLMEKGYRVKCMALPVGKKEEKEDLGGYLSRLIDLIEDVSILESGPHVERKQAYAIIRHIKFGPSKKGSSKKLKAVEGTSSVSKTAMQEEDPAELGDKKNTAWSVSNSSDDLDGVFDNDDDMKGASPKFTAKEMNAAPETARSTPQEPSIGTENRYARSEPRNQFPQKSIDNRGTAMRESFRSEPQFPNERRKPLPPNMNYPPSVGEKKPIGNEVSSFRNSKLPNSMSKQEQFPQKSIENRGTAMRESFRSEPQFPNERRKPLPPNMNYPPSVGEKKPIGNEVSSFRNSKLPNSMSKQEPSHPDVPNTRASGYGLFSNVTANSPAGQGIAANNHRNKEGLPNGTAGVRPNQNIPGLKSDDSQSPGPDGGGRGKFGIFSR